MSYVAHYSRQVPNDQTTQPGSKPPHQIHCLLEQGNPLIHGLALYAQGQRAYPNISVFPKPLNHHLSGADCGKLRHHRVGNPLHRIFPPPLEPQLLHRFGVVGITRPGEGIEVKIRLLRAHGPAVEGNPRLAAVDQRFNVFPNQYTGRNHNIEISQGPARLLGTCADEVEKRLRMVGRERMAEPSVGNFAGEFQRLKVAR